MTRVVAYTRPDGRVAICVPVVSRDDPPGFTAEDALARALAKDIPPAAVDVTVIDFSAVPVDKTFREAWRQSGKAIAVDMAAARAIHLDRLRAVRKAILDETDKLILRAQETGDAEAAAALAADRQALRDMPADAAADLAAASTPEELKAVLPAILDRMAGEIGIESGVVARARERRSLAADAEGRGA